MSYRLGSILMAVIKKAALVRGFLGALLVFEIVTKFTDLSNYEFASFFVAVVNAWNVVAALIGEFLGKFPLIPQLSSDFVNWFVFTTSVSIPGMFGAFVYADPAEYDIPDNTNVISTMMRNRAMFYSLSVLFLLGPILFYGSMNFSPSVWEDDLLASTVETSSWNNPLVPVYFITMLIPFVLAIFFLKHYRTGVLFLLGGLLAGTLFYYSPIISEQVREFTTLLESWQAD